LANVYQLALGNYNFFNLEIPKEQETEENVSWEDQTRINKFSNLVALNSELEENLKERNMEKEYLDDLSNELELMDDEDVLRYV
jgi:prefoldin subunit 4